MKSQTNGQQNNANVRLFPAKATTNFKVGEKRPHQEMNGSVGGLPGQAQKSSEGPAKIAKASDQHGATLQDGRKGLPPKPIKQ